MADKTKGDDNTQRKQVKLTEAQVKKAVSDYLQIGQNQGKWLFMRLNAGTFILQNANGSYRRRVQGVEKGTADYVVFQGGVQNLPICQVTFIEIKSSKGKQSPEQRAFEILAHMFNCRYHLIRDFEEIEEILK